MDSPPGRRWIWAEATTMSEEEIQERQRQLAGDMAKLGLGPRWSEADESVMEGLTFNRPYLQRNGRLANATTGVRQRRRRAIASAESAQYLIRK